MARSRVSASRSDRQVASRRSKTSRVKARLLLALPRPDTGSHGEPQRGAQLGDAKGPSSPFQRCSVPQLDNRRFTVDGAWGPSLRNSSACRSAASTNSGMP
jgi:hypothetical protein